MSRARTRGLLAVSGLAVALAGCVAGPDYHPPEHSVANMDTAKAPFLSAEGPGFSEEPLPDHWWELYNNPRIDELVQQALAANADLRAADANLRKADAMVRGTMGTRDIKTDVVAATSRERNYSLLSLGAEEQGITTYTLGMQFSYPLDLNGKIKRAIEGSLADRDAVEAARDAVRIAVAAATTKAYADACSANYQYKVMQRVIANQQSTLNATIRLQKGGRATAFDVTRARTAVETTEANLPGFVSQRQGALFLLATLLGKPPAEYPKDVETCDTLPTLSQPMPVGDGAAMIRRRPDIRQAERMIAGDTARIGVAMADLYPTVSIGGGLLAGGQYPEMFSSTNYAFGLGPLLSWNFPNRPIVKAKIDAANAQVDADIAKFDSTVLSALRGVEDSLDSYVQAEKTADALRRAAASAALSSQQSAKLMRFGRSDFLSVLSAQGNHVNVQLSYAAAQAKLVDRQIAVFMELGGGWQNVPSTDEDIAKRAVAAKAAADKVAGKAAGKAAGKKSDAADAPDGSSAP
ncbi:efflux transporter outer membrane subunit [Novosphingobium sp. 9]|uniref:efflux transporter outer membrane subunit n=1 Tax=Novosphingobium sp. 9 TaxID=2025349 RepID=UPI0021B66DE1|nr:efflux transporter outer membrane subunit [Novosphingobium sp. 9]